MTYLSTDAGTPRKNTYQTFSPPSPQTGLAKGYRKLTAEGLQAAENAARFNGLPADVQHPSQLLAAFKAAAPFLGLAQRLVWGLDWLFRFTRPQDWAADSRPIVWPSARMQGEDLMLSPTRVKALNRALINAGLIAAADSPNGKRYGIRDASGKITEAYGFDLSPLAARFEEFRRIAAGGRETRARMAALRRRATIARKAVVQLAALCAEYGVTDADCLRTLAEARHGLSTLKTIYNADELQDAVMAVEAHKDEVTARLSALWHCCAGQTEACTRPAELDQTAADHCVERTPAECRHAECEHASARSDARQVRKPALLGAEYRPHKEANKSSIHLKTPEVQAEPAADIRQAVLKTDADPGRLQKKSRQASSKTDLRWSKLHKGPGENKPRARIARPALMDQDFDPLPPDLETKSWSAGRNAGLAMLTELVGDFRIIDGDRNPALRASPTADKVRSSSAGRPPSYGISGALWSKACREIGVDGAEKALAIVAAKDPAFFTRSPAHYFCGCVGRLSLQAAS